MAVVGIKIDTLGDILRIRLDSLEKVWGFRFDSIEKLLGYRLDGVHRDLRQLQHDVDRIADRLATRSSRRTGPPMAGSGPVALPARPSEEVTIDRKSPGFKALQRHLSDPQTAKISLRVRGGAVQMRVDDGDWTRATDAGQPPPA